MIRINLLPAERERARTGPTIPVAHRITIAAVLVVLGTAAGIGWWYSSLRERSLALDAALVKAEADSRQIRSVLERVRGFETQKAVLQQRVSLIEQLRKGQGAPVQLMDEISRSLPERLWLNELVQSGPEFTITGMTDSLTAVSDFVANLEDTRWFRRPVEIVDSQVQSTASAGDLVRFQIKAQVADPGAPAAPTPVPAGGTGARPN
jgi:type IV pilus assembly protein PilN